MAVPKAEDAYLNNAGLAFEPEDISPEDLLAEKSERDVVKDIVNDVIDNTKSFLETDHGVPEDVMEMLKKLWLSKLSQKSPSDAADLFNAHEEETKEGGVSSSNALCEEEEDEIVVAEAGPSTSRSSRLAPVPKPAAAKRLKKRRDVIAQLDGPIDDSSDDDEDLDQDDDDDDDDDADDDDPLFDDDDDAEDGADEEPLGSGDDISDEDPSDLFNTANVVVCQYDKITRARNKWKFHLKDGIMNLNGKDYVFQRATGEAEW